MKSRVAITLGPLVRGNREGLFMPQSEPEVKCNISIPIIRKRDGQAKGQLGRVAQVGRVGR